MRRLTCPLCGGASKRWFELPHATIERCRSAACGLGFVAEQPDDEALAGYYRAFYYPAGGADAGRWANSETAAAEQHFAALDAVLGLRGERVLDFGCGLGPFLDVARDRGCDAVGVEYDDEARAAVLARGHAAVAEPSELGDRRFDLVYMNDVIEHLRDPVAALDDLRGRLAPGGAVFVVTMNMAGLKPRLAGARWDVVSNPTHLWFYDRRSLGATLRRAGLSDLRWVGSTVRWPHHGPARRLAHRALVRLRLSGQQSVLARP